MNIPTNCPSCDKVMDSFSSVSDNDIRWIVMMCNYCNIRIHNAVGYECDLPLRREGSD